jgi:hypothetical protein
VGTLPHAGRAAILDGRCPNAKLDGGWGRRAARCPAAAATMTPRFPQLRLPSADARAALP